MKMANLKDAKIVLNIAELIFSIVVGGLIGNIGTGLDVSKFQVICGVVYGYTIINIILCICIITNDTIPKNTRLAISAPGFVLWLTAGALILETVDKSSWKSGEYYDRMMAGGILSLATCVIYLADAFIVFKNS